MKLSRINTLLLVAIILVNGITILLPFVPAVLFKINGADSKKQALYREVETDHRDEELGPNRLIMPSILFDGQIHDGDASALKRGVWLRPVSNEPNNGNKVLVAHRFTYTNPQGAFYNLDKLKIGDLIAVVWQNQTTKYTVREIKVVKPQATYIEAPTPESRLTLYTCTPLVSLKDRLVVIARPIGDNNYDR